MPSASTSTSTLVASTSIPDGVRLQKVQYEKVITRIILSRETVKQGRKIIQIHSLYSIGRRTDSECGVLSNDKDLLKSSKMSDNDNKCSTMSVTMSSDKCCGALMLQ